MAAPGWDGRDPLPADPLAVLGGWLDEAFASGHQPNPHAIALATVAPGGAPEVRMVLCKHLDPARGELTFYTHYASPKGRSLAAHPRAAAAFYFGPESRQARLAGPVERADAAGSDAYFAGRPRETRIGAWASAQSEAIASRAELHDRVRAVEDRFRGTDAIPRPPGWGGYVLEVDRVELWISGPARIHDRGLWEREPGPEPRWRGRRLQP